MTFTGTLIEDLMATVERVEQRAHATELPVAECLLAESSMAEAWFAAEQEHAEYDFKLSGVA
ncbi:MAG: hypothetical protein WCB56_13385 [Terriglobales bacterium]|jgi:hypothetical protein